MFRRSKSDHEAAPLTPAKEGGKGRPTPTRREAEAAAKARAKAPRSRKERALQQRSTRAESSAKMREAMKTGDDRYLPTRDRGPVRRFVRDFVDQRLSYIEVLVPLLLVTMVLGYTGLDRAAAYSNTAMFALILLLAFNTWRMTHQLKGALAERFPDADTSGTTWYAVSRSLQMKFMRLPKPQVKLGQALPEHYR